MNIESILDDYRDQLTSLYYVVLTLGLFQLSVWLKRTLCLIWRTVLGTKCTTARYGEGSWAVVNGCNDALGQASAKYLAK